jgi:hypothetical protein
MQLTNNGDYRFIRVRSKLATGSSRQAYGLPEVFDDRLQNRNRALGRYSLIAVNLTSEPWSPAR